MIAMFRISLRNRFGIDWSASATSFSNLARSTGSFRRSALSSQFRVLSSEFRRPRPFARHDQPEVIALVADETFVAERLGPADAAAVEDQRVRGLRPPLRRHRGAELLFDDDRI